MASILRGAAKSQINLVDKSEYSAVIGANIVAIIGVFSDGSVDKGNYVSNRSELVAKMGTEVARYNSNTRINYAHSAANQALGTHSAMYIFRVTDGSELAAQFKPSGGVMTLVTKTKTDRWNGTRVLLNKIPSSLSNDQLYELVLADETGKVIESHTGSLVMTADDYLAKVVNEQSTRFNLLVDGGVAELDEDKIKFDKWRSTSSNLSIPLHKNGSPSGLKLKVELRSGYSKKCDFKVIQDNGGSGSVATWDIQQPNLSEVVLSLGGNPSINLGTLYSVLDSFSNIYVSIVDGEGALATIAKADRKDYVVESTNFFAANDVFESSEIATSGTTKTGIKKLVITEDNILSGGKSGLDDISTDDYIRAIEKLADSATYPVNLVSAPGVTNALIHKYIDSIIIKRGGNALQIVDLPDYADPEQLVSATESYNSKFMAIYAPWVETLSSNGVAIKMPPSGEVLQAIGNSDSIGEPWFAPAGKKRGQLLTATNITHRFSDGELDLLQQYPNVINPIILKDGGVTIWGNLTAYRVSSKLREVSVMRLLIYLNIKFKDLADQYLFDPNNTPQHDQWRLNAKSIMDDILARNGVYEYEVRIGEAEGTMTAQDYDQNIARGVVRLKPVGYMHWFVVNLEAHSYGSTFNVSESSN